MTATLVGDVEAAPAVTVTLLPCVVKREREARDRPREKSDLLTYYDLCNVGLRQPVRAYKTQERVYESETHRRNIGEGKEDC